jgi:SAM-dependent methyltransferase
MTYDELLGPVRAYYGEKVVAHGCTARGVDWNSPESQRLRFSQLLKVVDAAQPFSLNDYGCGYGALVDHLRAEGAQADYRGFDISSEMIDRARAAHPEASFHLEAAALAVADYTIASGIFNVTLGAEPDAWREYVTHTIGELVRLSRRGFAFNMLTRYSDADRMRADLYYADPLFYFDHVKTRYARNVALLHDYGLYEFTLLGRL